MGAVRRALLSVSDKTGIVDFAKGLEKLGIEILSTGGTAKLLRENNINVTEVSDYTGFPEIMDGRVKTLHPKIHGAILAKRKNQSHMEEARQMGIVPIDLLAVNLYPFEETIAKPNVTMDEALENIDIGGPTMIRAAAKNFHDVVVVVNPSRYSEILSVLQRNNCDVPLPLRQELAYEAFSLTVGYDAAISEFFAGLREQLFGARISVSLAKKMDLRYGENPHQKAAFYVERDAGEPCVANAQQLSGKELSFNNILDLNAALELVKEFEEPAVVIIKHTNPCGAACGSDLREAYLKALECDPVSAFGCIIALNREVNADVASEIVRPSKEHPKFVEAIIAPGFSDDALEIIKNRRNWGQTVRLLSVGELEGATIRERSFDMRRVVGGMLFQQRDSILLDDSQLRVVTEQHPSDEQMRDIKFAWAVCKHVKSNAIVLAKGRATVGVGAGQMSRRDSAEIAIKKAGERAKGSVMASDAMFPFRDSIDLAAEAGVVAVIQPGGSQRDEEVIQAANEHRIAMLFTGMRHFKH